MEKDMKRITAFLVVATFALLGVSYANNDTALLRYNLQEGQTYDYDINVKLNLDQKDEDPLKTSINCKLKYIVREILSDGSIKLGFTIDPLLDPKHKDVCALDFLSDIEFQMVQSPRGEILKFIGMKEILQKITDGLLTSGLDDSEDDEELLEDIIDYLEDEIADDFEDIFAHIEAAKKDGYINEEFKKFLSSIPSLCEDLKSKANALLDKVKTFESNIGDITNLSEKEKETLCTFKDECQKIETDVDKLLASLIVSVDGKLEKLLEETWNDSSAVYPQLPVKAGDNWSVSHPVPSLDLEVFTLIIVTDVNDKTVTLQQKFLPLKVEGKSLEFNGETTIDRSTGMVSNQKMNFHVKVEDKASDEEEDKDGNLLDNLNIELSVNLVE